MTRMYELTMESKFNELTVDQKIFFAKKIMREVDQIAEKKGISKEEAYDLYCHGLYGADRRVML